MTALLISLFCILLSATVIFCNPFTVTTVSTKGNFVANADCPADKDDPASHKQYDIWKWGGFQYQCRNAQAKVIGCVTSKKAYRALVSLGQPITVEGFWYNCTEANGYVTYQEEDRCEYGEQFFHVGEDFREHQFKRVCTTHGYDIVGCYLNTEDDSVKVIPVGATLTAGRYTHTCLKEADGTTRYMKTASSCELDGKIHKEGEKWKTNDFEYQCGSNGFYNITGCVTKDITIPLGDFRTVGYTLYKCYVEGRTIRSRTCDIRSPKCYEGSTSSAKTTSTRATSDIPSSTPTETSSPKPTDF